MMEQVVKCGNCGHDNPAGYRFCGMCGRAIPEPTPPPSRAEEPVEEHWEDLQDFQMPNFRRAPLPDARLQDAPPRTEMADPSTRPETSISGPSFLGIGEQTSAPEFSYLLDDEPSRGPGRVLVGLIIIAALAGTGWWQVKRHGGREWLYSVLRNPKVVTQSGRSQDGVPPERLDRSQAALLEAANNPNASKEADLQVKDGALVPKDGQPVDTKNADSKSPAADSSRTPGAASAETQQGTDHAATTDHPASTEQSAAAPTDHVNAEESVRKQNPAATNASPKEPGDRNEAAVRKQHSADSVKPSPRSGAEQASTDEAGSGASRQTNSAEDSDVRVAEKYLYGQGVPQDCGRALNLLKPAAEASNSKARSLLGTMYATGHCVPRDLPSSYRWFALALREEPNNRWVSRDLQSIWNQMSDSEKQTAMRMTR
jgi:Sel1 repeat